MARKVPASAVRCSFALVVCSLIPLYGCPSIPVDHAVEETLPTPGFRQPPSPTTTGATIEVRGFAQPNLTIEVYVNGVLAGTTYSDLDGEFRMSDVPLEAGQNVIRAIAIDQLGRRSEDRTAGTGWVQYAGSQYRPEIRIKRN